MKKFLIILFIILIVTNVWSYDIKSVKEGYNYYIEGANGKKESVDKALKIYEKLVKNNKEDSLLNAILGSVYFLKSRDANFFKKMGWVNKGKRFHDEAVKLNPDNIFVRMERGILSLNLPGFLGRFNFAVKDFLFLEKKINKIKYYHLEDYKGYKLFKREDESDEEFYKRTKQKIYYYRGLVELKNGSESKAKNYLRNVIEIKENYWSKRAQKKLNNT